MLFDTHAHPYLFWEKDVKNTNTRYTHKLQSQILNRFFWSTWKYMISIGCDEKTSKQSLELAWKYPGQIFASIWIHPCDIRYTHIQEKELSFIYDLYKKYTQHIVAIWEIWLDYYWIPDIEKKTGLTKDTLKAIQKSYFREQINIAKKLSLPIVLHARESNADILEILKETQAKNFVFHCYSGDLAFALEILDYDPTALFGIGWVLTFKNSQTLQEVVKTIPLKNIIIETDCPFLTPEPFRWREQNEPLYISYVLKKIQELRGESPEEIERVVFENGKRFYRL